MKKYDIWLKYDRRLREELDESLGRMPKAALIECRINAAARCRNRIGVKKKVGPMLVLGPMLHSG